MKTISGKTGADLLIIVLGTAAIIGGFGYDVISSNGRIGAGFLPVMAAGAMVTFAVANLLIPRLRPEPATVESSIEHARADAEPDTDIDIYGRSQKQRIRMLWTVLGLLVATVLLIPVLGFILAFGLLLVVIAVLVEKKKVLPSLVVSVIALASTYALFVGVLRVPLPEGIFGF